nr:MAG TPA: hypothetical protein [Caudoviricetes sp.]
MRQFFHLKFVILKDFYNFAKDTKQTGVYRKRRCSYTP